MIFYIGLSGGGRGYFYLFFEVGFFVLGIEKYFYFYFSNVFWGRNSGDGMINMVSIFFWEGCGFELLNFLF